MQIVSVFGRRWINEQSSAELLSAPSAERERLRGRIIYEVVSRMGNYGMKSDDIAGTIALMTLALNFNVK